MFSLTKGTFAESMSISHLAVVDILLVFDKLDALDICRRVDGMCRHCRILMLMICFAKLAGCMLK